MNEQVKRDIPAEAFDLGKKVGKWYLIIGGIWTVVVLICVIFMARWIFGGIAQIQRSNAAMFQQHSDASGGGGTLTQPPLYTDAPQGQVIPATYPSKGGSPATPAEEEKINQILRCPGDRDAADRALAREMRGAMLQDMRNPGSSGWSFTHKGR